MSHLQGLHSVNVFYAGKPINNSPFGVRIAPGKLLPDSKLQKFYESFYCRLVSDARKIRVGGRGIQPTGIRIGDDADFKIYTEGAGEGVPEIRVIGPGGVDQNVSMKKINGTTYDCHYYPTKEGRYVIMVTFGGVEIAKSPFEVNVKPKKDSSIVAHGPGLTGGVVGYSAAFVVETNGETGALGFNIAGPSQVVFVFLSQYSGQ